MLPPTTCSSPPACSIAATRLVVVVLPLLPVIPMVGPGQCSKNQRVIDVIGTPCARAAATGGEERGMLWDANTRSLPATRSAPCCPSA